MIQGGSQREMIEKEFYQAHIIVKYYKKIRFGLTEA